jgi:hypothetical protein
MSYLRDRPRCAILLTYFHSQESYETPDRDSRTGLPLDVGSSDLERPGSAKKNGGFFQNGLSHALETPHRGAGGIPEVKVVGNGHCHGETVCSVSTRPLTFYSPSDGQLQTSEGNMALLWWWRVSGQDSRTLNLLTIFFVADLQLLCWIRESWVRIRGQLSPLFSQLTSHSFDRRFRVYDISDYGETIRTYKRLANDEIVDEMILAGRGAPEP